MRIINCVATAAIYFAAAFVLNSAGFFRVSGAAEIASSSQHVFGMLQWRLGYLSPDNSTNDYSLGFEIAKGRLGAKGNMFDRLVSYRVLIELFGASSFTDKTTYKLLDYYVTVNFSPLFNLTAGQFKVPYTRQYIQLASRHGFTGSALPVENLKGGRDIGVEVSGNGLRNGKLEYRLGFFNGNGSNLSCNDNTDLEAAGRIALSWNGFYPYTEGYRAGSDGMTIGISGYVNHLATGKASSERTGIGIDITAGFKGLFLAAEYVGKKEGYPYSSGYYFQAGYMIIPATLEILGRYGFYDPDDGADFDTEREIRLGLLLYRSGHGHKVLLEYAGFQEETGKDERVSSTKATVQYQFNFK